MHPLAWKLVAIAALGFAALASVLPVLPSLPFLLLAAVAANRGWPRLERELSRHRALGPILAGWQERGALPRSLKIGLAASLVAGGVLVWLTPAGTSLALVVDVALTGFGAWLWTRPST